MSEIFGAWCATGRAEALVEPRRSSTPNLRFTATGRGAVAAAGTATTAIGAGARVACALDGRLDRADALAARVGARTGERGSPAGLALAAYEKWGPSFARQLDGDFAVAVVDEGRGALVLARDAFGVRPLHHASIGDAVAFATVPAFLEGLSEFDGRPDEAAIADFLAGVPPDEWRTLARGLRRVPPATVLSFAPGGVQSHRYWRPEDAPDRSSLSLAQATDALEEALGGAVAERVAGRSNVGVLLSGGLDSTAVALLAARHAPDIDSISATFDQFPEADERELQRMVADRVGGRWTTVANGGASAPATGVGGATHQPLAAAGDWLAAPLLAAAAGRGVDLVLTGIDGDRVVSHGEGWTAEIAAQSAVRLAAALARAGLSPLDALRTFAGSLAAARLPRRWIRRRDRRRARRRAAAVAREALLAPDLVARTACIERWAARERRSPTCRSAHEHALGRPDRALDLEILARLEGEMGVATAHPFYDRDVAELCVGLGLQCRRERARSRLVLRNLVARLGAPEVARRPDKAAFDAPCDAWMRRRIQRAVGETVVDFASLEPYLGSAARRALDADRPVDLAYRAVVLSAWLARPPPGAALPRAKTQ